MNERSSGILLHISSLRGEYGIGDFGRGSYEFIDFLARAGQKYWQILPLGITGFGDSPYQSFSAFAGNPYFIDLREFIGLSYLREEDIRAYPLETVEARVDYGLLSNNKMKLLRIAYSSSKETLKEELEEFYKENQDWLRDFALFMSIKKEFQGRSWLEWDEKYKRYGSQELVEFQESNIDEIYFWVFTQYYFTSQWKKVREYAKSKGIKIIGDLPIYVSEDSCDVWKDPENFRLDDKLRPLTVAGCPPDDFSDDGQLWGNPIYNWDKMKEDDYSWWKERIKHSFKLYDLVRIDHFRGFESYWEVKNGEATARNGVWTKGPGLDLFNSIKKDLGDLDIIVEDLGFNTKEVDKLVEDTGFPNMKILQFGFNKDSESDHAPHRVKKNMVVYTGTHDNNTIRSWLDNLSREELKYVMEYLKLNYDEGLNWGLIRGAWASVANLAIAPIQDFLNLDDRASMNNPGTMGENWTWRLKGDELREELAERIRRLSEIYWRL